MRNEKWDIQGMAQSKCPINGTYRLGLGRQPGCGLLSTPTSLHPHLPPPPCESQLDSHQSATLPGGLPEIPGADVSYRDEFWIFLHPPCYH